MGCFVIKIGSLKTELLEDMMKFQFTLKVDLQFVFDFKVLVFYK